MNGPRSLSSADSAEVLRINAESRPGVAGLDQAELHRLAALPNSHLAMEGPGAAIVGYALAFPSSAIYEGEEFRKLLQICPAPFLYIDQVAVDTSMRRKGVASILYKALERLARHSSMSALCCEVNLEPPNPGSMAFHENMGFKELGVLETADGRMVTLMSKPLE